MMYKKFLTVLLFVLITSSAFSAGSSGGSSGGGEEKPVTQFQIAEKMIKKAKIYNIGKKYEFLDKIFLNVLNRHPDKMPKIFFDMFNGSSEAVIKFLSNKSNFLEDLKVIFKMPKMLFIKNIF